MSGNGKKMLVLQVAALGWEFAEAGGGRPPGGLTWRPAEAVFPALTCPVQAVMRTGLSPAETGVPANGFYAPRLRKALFWEQSAALVRGGRIWKAFRGKGRTVGLMFWQQSLGESADLLLSPAPIHKHHGGMIQDCYARPADLYARLKEMLGRPFDLMRYWGPLASPASSRWIADALSAVMTTPDLAPDLLFGYLPGLDYDLQRFGPAHPKAHKSREAVFRQIEDVLRAAERGGYEVLVYGDYAIAPCPGGAVYPNRILREAGLFSVRRVGRRLYPDFYASRAVALADHEIALIHVHDPADAEAVRDALRAAPGIASVEPLTLPDTATTVFTALAEEGCWMAYRWWDDPAEAPDYAAHVDIHNKPGYDPCELFFGWPPGSVSRNDAKIRGTHGRAGRDRRIAWASSAIGSGPETLQDLARRLAEWLNTQ